MPKLEPYSKKLDYSYALGVFPALKLMENHPEKAFRLLLSPEGLDNQGVIKLREICGKLGVREEMAEKVLRRESQKGNCFAAVAFEKYTLDPDPEKTHAVLCQISDGGNAGTAMRSLLGFGLHDAALVRPCVDVFDPHVLRSSMGAFFHMRVRTYDRFEEYREQYPDRPLYPFMLDGAKTLSEVSAQAQFPCSLVFGNEQTGLPAEFAGYGQSVFIPQSGEVDSLNLAVAVSVGTYAFSQKGGFLK